MAKKVIGIDFGTTFSSIFYMEIGSERFPEGINFKGSTETRVPTLLMESEDGTVTHWGWKAYEVSDAQPDSELKRAFKRGIGNDEKEEALCRKFLELMLGRFLELKNCESLDPKEWRCVFGVPANWKREQKDKLREIAEKVGFPGTSTLDEPVAAMYNQQMQEGRTLRFRPQTEKFMVIDFGGGTLDISIVETEEQGKNPEAISVSGNPELGGIDFDKVLKQEFLKQNDLVWEKIKDGDKNRIRNKIQKIKEDVSINFSTKQGDGWANDVYTTSIALTVGDKDFEIRRDQLQDRCKDIIERTREAIKDAMEIAGLRDNELSAVILTGGSCGWWFMTKLAEEVTKLDSKDVFHSNKGFTDVALGLAISIGQPVQKHERQGLWVMGRIEGGDWLAGRTKDGHDRNKRRLLSPGRIKPVKGNEIYLGSFEGSQLLSRLTIELWFLQNKHEDKNPRSRAEVLFRARRNHPRIRRLLNAFQALKGKRTGQVKDRYRLTLFVKENDHWDPSFSFRLYHAYKDDENDFIEYQVIPGQRSFKSWFGLGGDRSEPLEEGKPAKKS